ARVPETSCLSQRSSLWANCSLHMLPTAAGYLFRMVVTSHRRSGSRRLMGPIRSRSRTVMLLGTDPSSRHGAHKPIGLPVPSPPPTSHTPPAPKLTADNAARADSVIHSTSPSP